MSIGTTHFPNALLDVHLRDLNLAEIKVLLVAYQALDSGATQCNWISGEKLQAKTGSSRRSISTAIGLLVQKGLVEIVDRQGNILREPVRRKGKTKLFFRLSPLLLHNGE